MKVREKILESKCGELVISISVVGCGIVIDGSSRRSKLPGDGVLVDERGTSCSSKRTAQACLMVSVDGSSQRINKRDLVNPMK